ncbi:MAG TPA: ribosome-associated translation inhibitor RaiA [Pirellulales bacterium]|nr:ribosome-associated translation inhibitor RaiA [Pirellulales bacterium]
MQIRISTRHGRLSEATQAKISAKLERLPRLFERLTAIELTVDLEQKTAPAVDLRVSAEHKHDFVATEQAEELMASVDGCLHKVEQQLRKYKQRIQDHHKRVGTKPSPIASEESAAEE